MVQPAKSSLFGDSRGMGFLDGDSGQEPACQCRRPRRQEFLTLVRKFPWKRAWQSTPVFFPRESHGQRSLAGYSPQCFKESDTNRRDFTHTHTRTRQRNHNLRQTLVCHKQVWDTKRESILLQRKGGNWTVLNESLLEKSKTLWMAASHWRSCRSFFIGWVVAKQGENPASCWDL